MMKITDLATHPQKYVTANEVAEYVRCTPRQVRKLVAAGTLKRLGTPPGARLLRISVTSVRRAFPEPAGR